MPDGDETLPTVAAYTGQTWVRIDSETSSVSPGKWHSFKQKVRVWQSGIGRTIESRQAHLFILFLITIDSGCVIADLGYSFLSIHCGEGQREPTWLRVLSHISLGVTSAFLTEIILALFAFGPQYYNPFGETPQATLHLFDALVIITTFVLEVVLRGREQEIAALLIVLRFWRIVKLVGGVAVGAGELSAEAVEELALTKEELRRTQDELQASQDEVHKLRHRLRAAGLPPDDPDDDVPRRRDSISST